MRLLKFIAFVAIVAGLAFLWEGRDGVVSAYRDDPTATEVRLDGLDIAFDKTPTAASPYALALAPDARRINLATVPTVPPDPDDEDLLPSIGGGQARMNGVVYGPSGPIAGAIVRIERHTLDGSIAADVGTGAGGEWSATGLLGGRYSVRAFFPGAFTSGAPEVFLLEDSDKLALDLVISPPLAGFDAEAVGQTHIVPGQPAFVAVTLGRWIVDAEGRLVRLPAPSISLSAVGFSPVSILSPTDVVTNAGGAVTFVVDCAEIGPAAINLSGEQDNVAFAVYAELPPCSFVDPSPPVAQDDEDEDDRDDDVGEVEG